MTFLCRTLRRTFLLNGMLPESCVAFLHADPSLPWPTELTETIEATPRGDGLYALRASWGREMVGSARALTRAIDEAVYRLALVDDASAPSLCATVLRVAGLRMVLIGDVFVDHFDLVVALIIAGAAFEGTGLVFLRKEGIVAHPAKPRLRLHRLASAGLSASHPEVACLELDKNGPLCTIDPHIAGVEWTLADGPANVLLFIELNEEGCSAMVRLGAKPALARLMRSLRVKQKPGVSDFARVAALIESSNSFRLLIGNATEAAAKIIANVDYFRVDA